MHAQQWTDAQCVPWKIESRASWRIGHTPRSPEVSGLRCIRPLHPPWAPTGLPFSRSGSSGRSWPDGRLARPSCDRLCRRRFLSMPWGTSKSVQLGAAQNQICVFGIVDFESACHLPRQSIVGSSDWTHSRERRWLGLSGWCCHSWWWALNELRPTRSKLKTAAATPFRETEWHVFYYIVMSGKPMYIEFVKYVYIYILIYIPRHPQAHVSSEMHDRGLWRLA